MSKVTSDDSFKRIEKVVGVVCEAKNLINTDSWGKSDPYCVVKGIRSNNHLVQMHTTRRIDDCLHPIWNEEFSFECPSSWGLTQLVGLKFFVYDSDERLCSEIGSDDFLGGADLDLCDAPASRQIQYTLELGGMELTKVPRKASSKPWRSLLTVQIKVVHGVIKKPETVEAKLLRSLGTLHRPMTVRIDIVKAKNLRNADAIGKSDPICIVRVVTLGGADYEIYRTRVINDSLNPEWKEDFSFDWAPDISMANQPAMLVFDVYDDDDDGEDVVISGDHLGSAMVPMVEFKSGVPKRRRLELHGDSQLLETRLQRDGKPKITREVMRANKRGQEREVSTQRGFGDKIAGWVTALKNYKRLGSSQSVILVEVQVDRKDEPMPHGSLLHKRVQVKEEEDVQEIMSNKDWKVGIFKVPSQIRRDYEKGTRPKMGTLRARDKIIFVAGVVRGATGLVSTDVFGKSDPYCIVEGVTLMDKVHFVHRTRVIQDKLCPVWRETFFFAVPEEDYLQRLNFFVYDSDDNLGDAAELAAGDRQDDFLGRMSVDLSALCSGENICEEIPLTGCKASRAQASKSTTTTFRRNSTISVDIRVERAPIPVYDIRRDQLEWTPPLRHATTRMPQTFGRLYADPSQREQTIEFAEAIAGTVLRLHAGNKLYEASRTTGKHRETHWLEAPEREPPEWTIADSKIQKDDEQDDGEELSAYQLEQLRIKQERHKRERDALCDLVSSKRSGLPTQKRCASLPALFTKFGRQSGPLARQFANSCPDWVTGLRFQRSSAGHYDPVRDMSTKPSYTLLNPGRR